VTQGLWEEVKWGDKRLVDTPISEAGFIGMGIGASMLGVRPVMELMFWSFYTVAWDQIVNNAAMVRYMSGGKINCPIVIRGPANGGTSVGATHSHAREHHGQLPRHEVRLPCNAYDAKGLLKAAIRDNDPVMFMESTKLYGEEWDVPANDEIPGGDLVIPLGVADMKRWAPTSASSPTAKPSSPASRPPDPRRRARHPQKSSISAPSARSMRTPFSTPSPRRTRDLCRGRASPSAAWVPRSPT
jgi:hypothetical protein